MIFFSSNASFLSNKS